MKLLALKLSNFVKLSSEETGALDALSGVERRLSALEQIGLFPGSREVLLLASGFAGVYRTMPDARRGVVFLMVPGDLAGLRTLVSGADDTQIASLSDLTLIALRSRELLMLAERYPRISVALWMATLTEFGILHQSILSLSRRSALDRVAYFLCELHLRLAAVGRTEGNGFSLPLTQSDLGEVLGLSAVHVNRTLQELRKRGLVSTTGRQFTLLDPARLRASVGFDPAYLRFRARSQQDDARD